MVMANRIKYSAFIMILGAEFTFQYGRRRHAGSGTRVKLISDGDVSASIDAALPEREVDALMGIGGTPEGVLSAAAIHCTGATFNVKPGPVMTAK
jgi:fructose-1,6-bisphosphatase/sedoheptulose 1,7-bisphosphatase-like protein